MFDPWVVLSNLSDPVTLLLMTLSACFGIIMGAVPGLSGTLGIALLLPFTFGLESATALLMLGSVYCGSEYGGSIPSILINTPGTAAALCTTFDGYPMAMKGQAQKALFTALISSVFGGIFGVSALLFLSVPLANVSMKFGAPEQFWLCVFALTIIASLSSGNVLKGVIGALIGLVLACVGMDPVTGYPRFTFNTMELMGGINVVPALIGLFAIPQALLLLRPAGEKGAMAPYNPAPGVFWQTLKDFFRRIWVTLVAGVIGVIVGIMPGAGGNIATFVAYNETKRFSKKPEEFGTGVMEGIMAPEVCNNAVVGGAQIPMLTLGIPGSAPAAVMLGALMTHGLKPGFDLFSEQGDIVFTYTFGLILSNFIILLLGLVLVRIFVRALKIPQHFLVVAILALSVVGSYSISSSLMDVLSMAACGLLGYVLVRYMGSLLWRSGLSSALRWRKDSSCRFISDRRKAISCCSSSPARRALRLSFLRCFRSGIPSGRNAGPRRFDFWNISPLLHNGVYGSIRKCWDAAQPIRKDADERTYHRYSDRCFSHRLQPRHAEPA